MKSKKRNKIIKKTIKYVILFVIAMFILSVVVFILARLAPGDPLQAFYGEALDSMNDEQIAAARARLGLDDNLFVQYFKWLGGALHGDFGLSLKYKMKVQDVMGPLIGNTLALGITAYIVVFVLAIVLATVAALHEDDLLDKIICKVGTATYYIPPFWLGVVLVLIFSVNLGWFPSSGAYDVGKQNDLGNRIWHMILPLIVMIASHFWYYAYMIRNKLLDEFRKDYVLLAKSKGLTRRQIVWKHCLRNVGPTIVSIMAIAIPHVISGTVVVEAVFGYPGIGNLAVESAKLHDYNMLMTTVLLTGAFVFFASFVAQAINEQIDPRMKVTKEIRW